MEDKGVLKDSTDFKQDRRDSVSSLGSCFHWLFDPTRVDHLPIEEQLKLYKSRDLAEVKAYKYATKIWGAPISRKRVIVAPPMEQNEQSSHTFPTSQVTANLAPRKSILDEIKTESKDSTKSSDKENVSDYKNWIAERKQFRKNLDGMGLSIEYLSRKSDLSRVEKSVLRRMIAERDHKPPESPVNA